jgi:hypothetical protein
MMRYRMALMFGMMFFLAAHGLHAQMLYENTHELCTDGEDNDEDGWVDCDDQDCQTLVDCAQPEPPGNVEEGGEPESPETATEPGEKTAPAAPEPTPPTEPTTAPPAPPVAPVETELPPNPDEPPVREPRIGVGLDVLHMLVWGIASGVKGAPLVHVPIEAVFAMHRHVGFGAGLHYRYEKDGTYMEISELAFDIGPRFAFLGPGLRGLYFFVKVGFGTVWGKDYYDNDYHRVDFVVHPEIGYAYAKKSPGFYLTAGLGLFSVIPMWQGPSTFSWSVIGKLAHYYMPVLNLTIGFSL